MHAIIIEFELLLSNNFQNKFDCSEKIAFLCVQRKGEKPNFTIQIMCGFDLLQSDVVVSDSFAKGIFLYVMPNILHCAIILALCIACVWIQ